MTATEIDALAAPDGDDQLLTWPGAGALADLAARNRAARRKHSYTLLDTPAADLLDGDASEPLIVAAGHQPGFIHPGVWVKGAAVASLAARVGGSSEYWIVDSDAVHRTALTWPGTNGKLVAARSIAPFPDRLAGCAFESLPPLGDEEWRCFLDALPAAVRSNESTVLPQWSRAFLSAGHGASYSARWRAGVEAIDGAADVPSPRYRLVSGEFDVCSANASARAVYFVAHVIANGPQTAQAYNGALAAYRARRGIAGAQHPIPDLLIDGSRVEVPLWAVGENQPRQRVYVSASSSGDLTLWADGLALGTAPAARLRSCPGATLCELAAGWSLRPRALALTMYLRLLACDVFIHGIGGAKYDQITDDVIRGLFGIEPPGYGCVTATLRLPLQRFDVSPRDLDRLHREGRDRRFNPQRLASSGKGDETAAVADLLRQREQAVAASMRLRSESPRLRSERRAQYEEIHRINRELSHSLGLAGATSANARSDPEAGAIAVERLRSELESNRVALGREWFVGLFEADRLRALASRAEEAMHRR